MEGDVHDIDLATKPQYRIFLAADGTVIRMETKVGGNFEEGIPPRIWAWVPNCSTSSSTARRKPYGLGEGRRLEFATRRIPTPADRIRRGIAIVTGVVRWY